MRSLLQFIREQLNPEPSHVMTFMRANPPTAGHEKVVQQVLNLAKKNKAGHSVVLSGSHDSSKNPLNPSQKLKHAKRAFPYANVSVASEGAPTILHQASKLHQMGVKHLHVVVGADRVEEFNKLLGNYNGKEGKHGFYNFNSINIHSAGARDPDAEGVEGMSATKMRQAAKAGDRNAFHSGASSAMSGAHKDEMFNDLRKGMGVKD